MRRTGLALTILVALFLSLDAGGKLFAPLLMIANSPPLGLPADPAFHRLLGFVLAACIGLYVVPRTAVLGAILTTAYLGGAVATHLRVGSPLFGSTLFGVYVGLAMWTGLWLRNANLRAFFPFAQGNQP